MAKRDEETGQISGGFVILARALLESDLWREGPDALRVFIYLLMEARYSRTPSRFPGFTVKRGEVLTSLASIAEDCEYIHRGHPVRWSRTKVHRLLGKLKQSDRITIKRDTYGTHVSIINYDIYQNPKRYQPNSSETVMKRVRNTSVTQVETSEEGCNAGKEGKETACGEESGAAFAAPATVPAGDEIASLEPPTDNRNGVALVFPVIGGEQKEWALTDAKLAEYVDSFPNLSVPAELRAARQYYRDNPKRRKSPGGMPACLTAWLTRSSDSTRGGSRRPTQEQEHRKRYVDPKDPSQHERRLRDPDEWKPIDEVEA